MKALFKVVYVLDEVSPASSCFVLADDFQNAANMVEGINEEVLDIVCKVKSIKKICSTFDADLHYNLNNKLLL